MPRRLRAIVDAIGGAIEHLRDARRHPPRRTRLERFGAIVQLTAPRALVFVDRVMARRMGMSGWREPDDDASELGEHVLSAPLEAHLQLTNRCGAGCTGCYTGASPGGMPGELGLDDWKRAIDHLAARGVFHVALGGGESATLPWLGELAAHARARGIIPNLTTSGLEGLDALVAIADRFGQINVSLDGLDATYAAVRGFDGFARADAAIRRLRAVKRAVGINVVVTRHNFDELDAIFAYAAERRLSEVELLRFKPSGRGAAAYKAMRCTDAQHRAFLPTVLAAARKHSVRVKVDCSYTPMLAHHRPAKQLLADLCVYGCTGGDFLVGAKPDGRLTACSFAASPEGRPQVGELASYWDQPDAFGAFRRWRDATEPCKSCEYHTLCRGGCKVVSAHVAGDGAAPDPECPRVIDARKRVHLPIVMLLALAACGAPAAQRCWVHPLPDAAVEAVALRDDGELVALGGSDRQVALDDWAADGTPRWHARAGDHGQVFGSALALAGRDVAITSSVDAGDGARCFVDMRDGATGAPRWHLQIPGDAQAMCRALAYDAADASLVLVGSFHGHVQLGGTTLASAGEGDLFVARLAARDGRIAWVRQLGGPGDEIARAVAIAPDRRIVIGGQFQQTLGTLHAAGDYDALVVALTPTGETIWMRGFGGPGFDIVKSIVIDARGSIAAAGAWMRPGDYGDQPPLLAGVMDGMLARISRDGELGDRLLLDAASSQVHHIAPAPDGSLWAIGHYSGTLSLAGTSLPGPGAYVARFDTKPHEVMRIGGTHGYAIATNRAGAVAVGGAIDGDGSFCGATIHAKGAFAGRIR